MKMTKDVVPQDFTLGLALVDAIPVLFFGINCILIGKLASNGLFMFGAILCFLSGAAKVLWKIIVVLKKKNVWPLFIQMRILMPIGFLIMIISCFINSANIGFGEIWAAVISLPSVIFFVLGILGMVLMGVFAAKLDSSDLKSNWIEQLTNGASQFAIFIGILFLMFK